MSVIKRPVSTIRLPPRDAKLIPEADVLVVGGGPAGIGAAIGAAEAGARVVLAERYGFLGGNATAGLVLTLASYYTSPAPKPIEASGKSAVSLIDNSIRRPVIAGVLAKLVERLVARDAAFPPSPKTGFIVPFDPEGFKLAALEMVAGTGVELLFHAFASGVVDNGSVKGVIFETKSGPVVVNAKVTVDCTGDGDIASFAGAEYEVGSEVDGLCQPMTLMFLLSGFQPSLFERYVKQYPEEWNGVQGLKTLMDKAVAEGGFEFPREDILFFGTTRENDLSVNSTRITGVSGTDVWDLTRAEIEGRKQITHLIAFLKKYVPGFEKAYLAQTATKVCVRETRRILGEYKLTAEDVLEAHKFSDVIAHGAYPVDLHNPKGKGTIIKKVKPGEAYDIPLRCLIPLKIENLVVAGRCISGTHEAQSSYRVMPISMATGQAAGVCAALACKSNQVPRKIGAMVVQKELVRQGAYLEVQA